MTQLPRILVVDDEEAILETMTFTFADDYEVFTSTDARSALDILDEKSPIAVVLTDQRMPGMSGVEFVTEVFKERDGNHWFNGCRCDWKSLTSLSELEGWPWE